MKKILFVPAVIFFFSAVGNCHAAEGFNMNNMVKNIKYSASLSDAERMPEMQKYVCGLPDARLMALMEQIGPNRFLADILREDRYTNHSQTTASSRHPEKIGASSPPALRKQLDTALHTPEHKMRLCRNIANYLLNTNR